MKPITKALAGTIAAGAMAVTSAAPAFARDRHDNGIDAGDVIAGAVIIGGIAAILGSKNNRYRHNDGYRYRDRDYRPRYDQRRGNGRRAVEKCIRAVERDARRAGYRFADVTEIRDVDRERYGWEVKGRLVVDGQRGWRGNNRGYNHRGNYRNGYRGGYNNYDQGRFTCDVSRGRVVDIDYRGIRGLR